MRGRVIALDDFSGGLNLRDSPWDLRDNESPYVRDMRPVGLGGAIAGRGGEVSVTDWTALAAGDFGSQMFRRSDDVGFPRFYVALLSGKLLEVDLFAGSQVVDAGPHVTADEFALVEAPATGGQGPVYFTTPAVPRVARQWDGATNAAWTASAGTIPLAFLLLYHGNRVWAAHTTAIPDGVWWSELADPRNWPVANVNRFGVGDGEEIRAIAPIGPNIVVFKQSRSWLIYDLDTGANRPIGTYGSVGPRVLETPYGLIFEDPARGLCLTDGVRVDTFGDLIGGGGLAGAAYIDDSLFVMHTLALDDGSAELFEYRFKSKTWWAHTAPGLRALAAADNQMYGIRSTDTKLYRFLDSSSAVSMAGAAFQPRWRSRFMRLGDSQVAKRIRSVEFAGEGILTLNARKDQAATPATASGPYTLPTTDSSRRQRVADFGTAYALQLELVGSSALPTDVRIDELSVRLTQRRD